MLPVMRECLERGIKEEVEQIHRVQSKTSQQRGRLVVFANPVFKVGSWQRAIGNPFFAYC